MSLSFYTIFLPLFLLLWEIGHVGTTADPIRKPYIIYLGNAPSSTANGRNLHYRFLSKAVGEGENVRDLMVYSYLKSFNAFAAKLRPEEAHRLAGMDGVLSVFPSGTRKLHTTRSWDYLGFPETAKRSFWESKVVIGLLDTGVWPNSASFNDSGMGPPPRRWRGKCDRRHNFTCNNKIIGARFYRLGHHDEVPSGGEEISPRDTEGHGTHTASTAAGAAAAHSSLYGLAQGTARGGTPSARLAIYKVCWFWGCEDMDLLAAFDQAIHDGVHVISVSIGGYPMDYLNDVLAIGSFHAMRKGITTCMSAGNDGPSLASLTNVAPWVLTVAASAIDRQFRTLVRLGNGRTVRGISLNTYEPLMKSYPLITGRDAAVVRGSDRAAFCEEESMDKKKVEGKIVYCENGMQPESVVKRLGGVGVIKPGDGMWLDVPMLSELPSSTTGHKVTRIVKNYINSSRSPAAVIYKSQAINVSKPLIASFSSRGPNPLSLNILKPDISAPGLSILAAWSNVAPISESASDKRRSSYNIISGTSMACPHVSATAAYVKSFHPLWSPAAIKSAIMTTAKDMSSWDRRRATELGYGSGLIDPLRAINPGLVYDMDEESYVKFLCKEGYNDTMIAILEGKNRTGGATCSRSLRRDRLGSDGLNYPSMQRTVGSESEPIRAVFRRRVTNVGKARSVYKAEVKVPRRGLVVQVRPETLAFQRKGEKKSFKVVVVGEPLGSGRAMVSASLVWKDKRHVVRSPIVVLKKMRFL